MRTQQEIAARLMQIEADERYHYPAATVFENAPLALIQTAMEQEALVLAWILEIDPPKAGAQDKFVQIAKRRGLTQGTVGYLRAESVWQASRNAALDEIAIKAYNGDFRDLTAHGTANEILALKSE